jgi:hypothetical protein
MFISVHNSVETKVTNHIVGTRDVSGLGQEDQYKNMRLVEKFLVEISKLLLNYVSEVTASLKEFEADKEENSNFNATINLFIGHTAPISRVVSGIEFLQNTVIQLNTYKTFNIVAHQFLKRKRLC